LSDLYMFDNKFFCINMPNIRMHIVIYSGKEIMPFQRLMTRKMPAGRALLPEGDFRDWNDIEASAIGIARAQSSAEAATI
jgi:hypothetical protein